ncbi:hypothetical protein [Gimesia maris]|uniref:hypothetical protein n=1 Tax=Gimesia maris TaxID=122 RepID=UPI0032EB0194
MAGNEVNIKITGDDRDMLMTWQRQNTEILKNQQRIERLGRAGKRSGEQVKGGFDSALGTFGKFAGAITGVGGVIGGVALAARQLLAEFERIKELQKTDADKQVEFEQSLVQAVRNAGGLFDGDEIKQIALDLEKDTGVQPVKIAEAISSALSARGPTTKKQAQEAIDATKAALRYAPELNAEESAFLAGAGIDTSKRYGFSPEESIGFLQNVGSLARVTDLNSLAQNVAPAVNNLSQFGNSPQEAGSLVSAVTQGVGDFSGRMSGTAVIQLAKQLRDRGIGSSTAEGIKLLQEDEKLRKKFLEGGTFKGETFPKASFEAKADPTIRDLLDKNSFIAKSYQDGIGKIGGAAEALGTFNDLIAENEKITRTSRLRRQTSAAADTANIQDEVGGLAASVREGLGRALDSANFSDIRKKALIAEFEARSLAGQEEPLEVGQAILQREQRRLLVTEKTISAGTGGGGVTVPDKITKEEQQSADVLNRFEKILNSFIMEQQRVNQPPQRQADDQQKRAIEENTKALKENNRLREKEQRTPTVATVPPRRREPFRVPAEDLDRGK